MRIEVRSAERGYAVTVDGARARRWKHSSRCVYVIGDVVVKVGDPHQCLKEVERWNQFTPAQRAMVARLLAHGTVRGAEQSHWVAMERVRGRRPTHKQWHEHRLGYAFDALGVRDASEYNVLLTKSGPVVVDYGL